MCIRDRFIVLKQFELIVEREKCIYSFPEIEKNLDSDRLRLFQTASVMFMTGGAISFLIGFFGMQGKLEYELLLTAVLLLIGIFIRFIPFITKKHNMQNTIFLAICMIGKMCIRDKAKAMQEKLSWIRREIHKKPEVGMDLPITTAFVMEQLEKHGIKAERIIESGISALIDVYKRQVLITSTNRNCVCLA